MSIESIASSSTHAVYTRATATSPRPPESASTKSAPQITYQDRCGDTVNLQGVVVADRTNPENVGQPATLVCNPKAASANSTSGGSNNGSNPLQQKLAAAYSAY